MVTSMPFVGSNPALAATSPSLTVACSASACKLRHSVKCFGHDSVSFVPKNVGVEYVNTCKQKLFYNVITPGRTVAYKRVGQTSTPRQVTPLVGSASERLML